MNTLHGLLLSGAVLIGGASAYRMGLGATNRPAAAPKLTAAMMKGRKPILVELFTSEGCSSCPSADRYLQALQRQPIDGALIIPLSEHVDYWNNSSWSDRFSSHAFTTRQLGYVGSLHADSSYTPQMVVDGQSEFVGSDRQTATNAIANALRRPKANVEVSGAHLDGGSATAKIDVSGLGAASADAENAVYVAITENNLETRVGGGENGGATLYPTGVVRSIERVGEIGRDGSFSKQVSVNIKRDWKRSDLSIVAFVQGRNSLKIFGSGITSL